MVAWQGAVAWGDSNRIRAGRMGPRQTLWKESKGLALGLAVNAERSPGFLS